MILVNAVQGTAGATVPFTPGSVATHVSGDRLTLYVMGLDTASSTPDTPTATNGWVLIKSYLDATSNLFVYVFAIQATSSSMAAPEIAFPGSTPSVTGWAMSSHRQTSGRYWKDPIGTAGNDGTTYADYIFPRIAGGSQYGGDNYPLPTDWFGNGLSAVFGVGAVPTDSSSALDEFNTGFSLFNMSGGTNLRATTQYVESSAGGGLAVAWWSRTGYSGNPLENVNAFFQLNPTTAMDGLVCAVIMREDTVAPPAVPSPASGSAALTLSGAGAFASAAGPASLSLSATGEAENGDAGWITLDLSLTEFMYNPNDMTPFGQYVGGKIQKAGTNQIYFQHPDLRLMDLNVYKTYDFEVTYDAATVYTRIDIESRPLATNDSWWNDSEYYLMGMGAFSTFGMPVLASQFGMNTGWRNDWILANNAGHDALVFTANQAVITQIRYRETPFTPIDATASLSLSASALYDAPAPPPATSPLLLDMTPASVTGAGSKVGSGNVWSDSNDGTYFELNGQTYFPEPQGSLNAGWVTVPIPALPGLTSIDYLNLDIRAEFYGIAGTPTNASLWIAIGEETSSNPFVFQQEYAYLIPGNNFPVVPLGSIQELHYELDDWEYATLGYPTGLDPLAPATLTALRTGTATLIISPRYWFGNSSPTHRIQGKFYNVSFSMGFQVGTPSTELPLPGLPSGYTDWQELDLSTAIFYHSGAPDDSVVPATPTGNPYGRYDAAADRILTNVAPYSGWPDFSIPGFQMDVEKDYYFQFVFDSLDVRDTRTARDAYLWLADPDDPHLSYYNETYGSKVLYNNSNNPNDAIDTDFHMFHLDPVAAYNNGQNWDQLANGFTLPIFEIRQGAVLAAIRYATREDGYLPPAPYSPPAKARAHFWGR